MELLLFSFLDIFYTCQKWGKLLIWDFEKSMNIYRIMTENRVQLKLGNARS